MKPCLLRLRGDASSPARRHRLRRLAAALPALLVTATLIACEPPPPENAPYWHPGTTVDATNVGPFVRIQWDATTGGDPTSAYQINLGTYNGTVVALVPATVRDCYISGLAASTAYTIVVTARDAQMHWSGPLPGTQGNRTTTITTTANGGAGTDLWCHLPTDTDADRLPDVFETDDGTYANAADAGTDPANPDTDNDGIKDGDEALGRTGLNLIAMGARPTHKDYLIEADWVAGAPCSTQPTAARLAPVVTAFANAPVANPDGTTGIKLIVDRGQGGHFTGGTSIPDTFGPVDGNYESAPFVTPITVADERMNPNRKGIFRYSITHYLGNNFSFGGWTTVVSHPCHDSQVDLRYPDLFMHEIGHTLTLNHGGDVPNAGYNYNSIMSHYVGYTGVDDDCDGSGDGRLDFSHGDNPDLDENALDENLGVCNGVDRDFNRNHVIDPGLVSFDNNNDGQLTVLRDFDDWAHIESTGLAHNLKFVFWD